MIQTIVAHEPIWVMAGSSIDCVVVAYDAGESEDRLAAPLAWASTNDQIDRAYAALAALSDAKSSPEGRRRIAELEKEIAGLEERAARDFERVMVERIGSPLDTGSKAIAEARRLLRQHARSSKRHRTP